ncbi:MAG TPA: nuclear transport factor 2 family protein [Terriglobales bacterium]|nr:nuclear transport factor 2 family protein [Terriglobales bacterium]
MLPVALAACLALSGLAAADNELRQTHGERKASPALTRGIYSREEAVWHSVLQRNMKAFRELVAVDARMVFPSGVVTRQQYIDSTDQRQIRSYKISDFEVFQPSANVVIATYRATLSGIFRGRLISPTTVREGTVWVKRKGKWVAVWNQETAVE